LSKKITGGWQIWGEALGFGEGVSGVPFPNRGGAWGGRGCDPSPENFLTFWLKIVNFGIYSDKNNQFSIE